MARYSSSCSTQLCEIDANFTLKTASNSDEEGPVGTADRTNSVCAGAVISLFQFMKEAVICLIASASKGDKVAI